MSHGTEQHLEHAEHAQHAAHNPFDRKVAMSMAIVAAVLAFVTLLSHREHNHTLVYHTEASDQWNYFQSKKNRMYLYEASEEMLAALKPPASGQSSGASEGAGAQINKWAARVARYDKEAEEIKQKAEGLENEAKHAHKRADRYDLGELGVELALVLCSVAVLTKQRGFWYFGIGFAILGVVVAGTGYFLH